MSVASPLESPRVLGVCSGIGGLERGVRLALRGARTVGLVERDAYAAAVLLSRMEGEALDPCPVFAGDLREFPAASFAGAVDLVCGGIPCQPYSVAGKQRRGDDERDLVVEFLRIVRDVGPAFVFVENVGAFVGEQGLGRLVGPLAALGFDAEWSTLRASDAGAPHRRERCFVLARRAPDANGGAVREQPERGCRRAQAAEQRNPEPGDLGARRLADSDCRGRQVLGLAKLPDLEGARGSVAHGRRDDWPLDWPPGPSDRDGWDAVLERDPGLAPALRDVRRVAHGLPEGLVDRLDRLRCLGNAVVPAQAAMALRMLLERMEASRG